MRSTLLIVSLWLFEVFVSKSYQATVIDVPCELPDNFKEWEWNPQDATINVDWNDAICNIQMCDTNATSTTDGPKRPVQLRPVELQPGNKLWFHPHPVVNGSFPFIYRVTEEGFYACQTRSGVSISSESTSESFQVKGSFLQAGPNYFIVESAGLIRCDNGLRVKVTVKTDQCQHQNGRPECGGRGRCATAIDQTSYSCQCCGNYKGTRCQIYDACLSNPCFHGGDCIHKHTSDSSHSNATYMQDYYCKCPLGFSGAHCEKKADNVCNVVQCLHNSTCNGNATDFHCACLQGWTGTHCEVNINECESSPCRHGRCIDRLDGFECQCNPGYLGENCEERRRACSLNACRPHGFCENKTKTGVFAFSCHCTQGWTGPVCRQKVSPCQPNPCSPHGTCLEEDEQLHLETGYKCRCLPGFTGTHCEVNINDCDPNPCHYGGHCKDLPNDHTCLCINSHAGSNCQYTIDIFNPMLGDIDAVDQASRLREENRNLYIMAASLSVAVIFLVLAVILFCFWKRAQGSPQFVCCARLPYLHRSPSGDGSLTFTVDVNNSMDCPLASDSFFKDEPGCGSMANPTFQNQLV